MPQNDPKRGKNFGQPNLDELLNQWNKKLARLLGSKGPSEPPRQDIPPPVPGNSRAFKGGGFLIFGIVIALWLLTGLYRVNESESAVVLRLGSFQRMVGPGLHWHWPYPFEQREIVNVSQVRSLELGYRGNAKERVKEEAQMLTAEQNLLDLQLSVQYDIKDARDYLFNNVSVDRADAKDIVKQAAETAARDVVGRSKIDFVLGEGRQAVQARIQTLMQQVLDRDKSGVRVIRVSIDNAQPPEAVQAAFDEVRKAGLEKEKLRSEAQAYASDILPKAKGTAAKLQKEAEGYKQSVVANAQGDTARFNQVVAEYSKAPKVMRDRIYYDTMQQIFSNTTKVLVDQKNGSSLLNLPLDKLIEANSPPPAAKPAAPQATPPAAAQPPAASGTDSNRKKRVRDFLG